MMLISVSGLRVAIIGLVNFTNRQCGIEYETKYAPLSSSKVMSLLPTKRIIDLDQR
jgi:hypothetical protein